MQTIHYAISEQQKKNAEWKKNITTKILKILNTSEDSPTILEFCNWCKTAYTLTLYLSYKVVNGRKNKSTLRK